MTNHERISVLNIGETVNLICYLCHDCITCPVGDEPEPVMEKCKEKLAAWLQSSNDKSFWDELLKGVEQHE